ncbi:hypothetical protein CAPTEDRAFT_190457 [Capitella teleta]|uniref:Apple domain-containing protein n=1 Tax=Capitella teleta TaxID=283909 RepID=R7T436_CAPTE|nr:hypothetical protein CAPTEDRAFT_190457 [Capitella teleta]|eukprot:ELT87511.1 hypothetical protein CAPTEDRAFT_190457 [Capitella teleta]
MASIVLSLALVFCTLILNLHCTSGGELTSDAFAIDKDLSIDNRALLRVTDSTSLVECAAECGSHACCLTALFKPETETTGSCSLHSTRKLNVETYFESSSVLMFKESSDALDAFEWECIDGFIRQHNLMTTNGTTHSDCKQLCLNTTMCLSFDYDLNDTLCSPANVTKAMPSITFENSWSGHPSYYCELNCIY